jgi:hypothetical protein
MCDDREKLIAYLYDEVSASERREFDAHLHACDECRDELRGFRDVRQDLLAFDVPEHGSVWKPFVTPAAIAQPWWKQVPVWGLAAAASLVFAAGLGGVMTGRMLMPAVAAAPTQAQAQPVPQAAPQTIAATPEQLHALEERLASIERIAQTRPVETASTRNVALTRDEVEQIIKESEGRINQRTAQKLYRAMLDLANQHQRDKSDLTLQINAAQSETYQNVMKVANRGIDKDKEQ